MGLVVREKKEGLEDRIQGHTDGQSMPERLRLPTLGLLGVDTARLAEAQQDGSGSAMGLGPGAKFGAGLDRVLGRARRSD